MRHAHAVLGRRVLAEHEQHRIADEAEQRERDQAHRQHDEDGLGETAQDEGEHGDYDAGRGNHTMPHAGFRPPTRRWQRRHGRHGLPWQGTRDPYRVWLAEVMLQQTQVAAVIPYYERFLARFPEVGALAAASQEDVLRLWSGLGYYARGRNLHAAAQGHHRTGGISAQRRRTSGAARRRPLHGRGDRRVRLRPARGDPRRQRQARASRAASAWRASAQWELAERLLPARGIRAYTQALMDLGATVCTRAKPACERCPVAARLRGAPRGPHRRAAGAAQRRAAAAAARDLARAPAPGRRVCSSAGRARGLWGGLWIFPGGPV